MKLYGDFTKEDWLKFLNINSNQLPKSFIIHGEWEPLDNLIMWKKILHEELLLPKWNAIVGKYDEHSIGYANVYGSPSAALITHQFAAAGTNRFIQTGYCGGLSFNLNYGDILIVTEAEMNDGTSHWYIPNKEIVYSNKELVYAAIDFCTKKGYSYVTGSIISISAMLVETHEMLNEWAMKGHFGVDMETATTLAVAKKFNKKAISLLNVSDHLIKGDTLYSYTKDRELIEAETDEKIRELALYLASIS